MIHRWDFIATKIANSNAFVQIDRFFFGSNSFIFIQYSLFSTSNKIDLFIYILSLQTISTTIWFRRGWKSKATPSIREAVIRSISDIFNKWKISVFPVGCGFLSTPKSHFEIRSAHFALKWPGHPFCLPLHSIKYFAIKIVRGFKRSRDGRHIAIQFTPYFR